MTATAMTTTALMSTDPASNPASNPATAAYLRRLGLPAEPPSAEALARLHRAHVERIPYETFWIHLGHRWGIDPLDSLQRLAGSRRGGYCFQLNGALAVLLERLGYQVSRHVAGVHDAGGPTPDSLGNHVALIVDGCPSDTNPSGRWYVDTGLGDALHEPLPLTTGVVRQGPMRFGLTTTGPGGVGDWHLTHDRSGSFAGVSILEPAVAADRFTATFAPRHTFNTTSPESSFARTVTAQRRHPTGTSVLRGCVFTRTDGDDRSVTTVTRLDELLALLGDEFGLVLDVPRPRLAALWQRIEQTHDQWLRTDRRSA